jgi:hypothetical protein
MYLKDSQAERAGPRLRGSLTRHAENGSVPPR